MFAKVKDNTIIQFPYGIDELKIDNPHTKYDNNTDVAVVFPTTESSTIDGCELVGVMTDEVPIFDAKTQKIVQSQLPFKRNDVWYIGWDIVDLTDEEQADLLKNKSAAVRSQRLTLLKESDWTQGKDIPDSVSAIWAEYREQLRNISQQENFPWEVSWPQVPNI